MADSAGEIPDGPAEHRPSRPGRRTAVLVIGTVAVVLLVAAVLIRAHRPGGHREAAAPQPVTTSAPAPAATAPTSTAPAPSTAPVSTPPRKARSLVPHDHVAAAAPSSFRYAGTGYTIKASVCGMEFVRPLDPPGEQHHTVCWVQHDFGFAPGSHSRGTTYVLGHSWGQDSQEVLNKISEAAMRQVLELRAAGHSTPVSGIPTYQVTALTGDVITLRTGYGVLTYTVRNAYAVAKEQAGNVQPLMATNTRNRVVIITCGELRHVDYDYNIIVQAYLTSSTATTEKT